MRALQVRAALRCVCTRTAAQSNYTSAAPVQLPKEIRMLPDGRIIRFTYVR